MRAKAVESGLRVVEDAIDIGIDFGNIPRSMDSNRNPKVDEALKAGDWARALQELKGDPPVAFICTPERLAVVDSRVKNPQVGPYGYLETLPDWEVAE